jgi:hypothetical protein
MVNHTLNSLYVKDIVIRNLLSNSNFGTLENRNLGPIGLHNAHNEETPKIAQNITAHVQALNKLVI